MRGTESAVLPVVLPSPASGRRAGDEGARKTAESRAAALPRRLRTVPQASDRAAAARPNTASRPTRFITFTGPDKS
jgi:hypothetical protein